MIISTTNNLPSKAYLEILSKKIKNKEYSLQTIINVSNNETKIHEKSNNKSRSCIKV